jgi:hypothetical protein
MLVLFLSALSVFANFTETGIEMQDLSKKLIPDKEMSYFRSRSSGEPTWSQPELKQRDIERKMIAINEKNGKKNKAILTKYDDQTKSGEVTLIGHKLIQTDDRPMEVRETDRPMELIEVREIDRPMEVRDCKEVKHPELEGSLTICKISMKLSHQWGRFHGVSRWSRFNQITFLTNEFEEAKQVLESRK